MRDSIMLNGVERVEIKYPYKSVIFRMNAHEARYEVFYSENEWKEFLELLVRSGYPMSVQELIDGCVDSELVCFGCGVDFEGVQ